MYNYFFFEPCDSLWIYSPLRSFSGCMIVRIILLYTLTLEPRSVLELENWWADDSSSRRDTFWRALISSICLVELLHLSIYVISSISAEMLLKFPLTHLFKLISNIYLNPFLFLFMLHPNVRPSFTILVLFKGMKIQGCYVTEANFYFI